MQIYIIIRKMQILRYFIWFNTLSLRTYALIIYCRGWVVRGVVRSFGAGSTPTKEGWRSAPKRGAGGIVRSFRPGSVRRRRAEVRPEAGDVRLVGRAGVLGLTARCVGLVRWKRSASPKPSPWALACGGIGWSFGLDGSLRWISAVEEVGKPKAQPICVGALPKFLKLLKFLL